MRHFHAIAVLVPVLLVGCQTRPPIEVTSSLRVSPDLELIRPSDIAVLPVEDATPERSFEGWSDVLRQSIARELVQNFYAPLSNVMVDQALASRGEVQRGSPVDAEYVSRVAGSFEEDGLLGVRMLEWDDRSIMQNQRVRFSMDVLMLATDGRKLLWSGRLDGSVKAGGEGPAPIGRNARTRSAVEVMARALIGELPRRRT